MKQSFSILQKMIKIYDILDGKKSTVAFCIHDSIVIDLHADDKHLMKEIIDEFLGIYLRDLSDNILWARGE